MQTEEQTRKCPVHRLFRPKSTRVGIGPVKYVWWYTTYVLMQFFNRALARDPNRKVSWDKWPKWLGLIYVMTKLRYNRSNALTDSYDYATNDTKDFSGKPDAGKGHYTSDGLWVADSDDPQMGAMNTRFGSNIPPKKVRPDPENIKPSAREAGKLRWRRVDPDTGEEITTPALILNVLAGWWIQFQVHNFEGNTQRDPISKCPHFLKRNANDSWPGGVATVDRTSKDPTRLTDNGRPTVINERTAAWLQQQIYPPRRDAEQRGVFGPTKNDVTEAEVRSFTGGKFVLDHAGRLPEDPNKAGIDLAGFNNNFNPGLSLLHWLFAMEHNALCDHYAYFHPDWDDETLWQMAKMANAGQIARIHTTEWTIDLLQHPALQIGMHADWYGFLGQKLKMYLMRLQHRHQWVFRLLTPLRNNDFIWGMPGSKWDHHDGPYQVPVQFRMVYRLHEMLLSEFELIEPGTDRTIDRIKLLDFVQHHTRDQVTTYGYDVLAYSFVKKSCGALTLHNFPRALTQFENQQDNTLTDLSERDLFRERTDGCGTYNEFRMSVGEPPVTSFLELTGGDAELAREISLKYEGDVDKVDAGIGILCEPKPAGFALGFTQFYQFVLNAPRRVKSNRHLSEGFTYKNYREGMDWIEHAGGILGVIGRHLKRLKPATEGVVRGFSPWPETETFPLRQLNQTHADTAEVAKADIRTLVLGALTLGLAAWTGLTAHWVAWLAVAALFVAPACQAVYRMLAMRFMQEVWKKCYTDKRSMMFGTLYRGETWIKVAALFGRLQAVAVVFGFGHYAWAHHAAHPIISALAAVVALSGIATWKWSNRFAQDAQVLKVSLRNRMREGSPITEGVQKRCSYAIKNVSQSSGEVNMPEFEDLFRRYAPGRDYMTGYDFSRMHEGERLRAAREGRGNFLSRWFGARLDKRFTKSLLIAFADTVAEEDRKLVPAISKEMLLRVLQGKAEIDLAREKGQSNNCPDAAGLGWKETYEGGSESAEESMIRQWMVDIQRIQQENEKTAHANRPSRAFHARSRAGIGACEFRVSQDIPEFLQVGFLKPGSVHKAKARFSNASGTPKPDTEKDLRGAAFEVELSDGAVQDFLMTNAPANHARNASQFIDFAQAGAAGKVKMIPTLIGKVGLFEAVRILKTVIRQSSRPVSSLATEAYWSRAPYAVGPYALKYALFPASSEAVSVPKGPDCLREDFIERLKLGPVVFDFKVQLFVDEMLTPIEDGSVEWKEADSPFITVGQLYIPQQDLASQPAQAAEAEIEKMGFNPWKTVPEIRPLGSLNRARKLVYQASQLFRKQ